MWWPLSTHCSVIPLPPFPVPSLSPSPLSSLRDPPSQAAPPGSLLQSTPRASLAGAVSAAPLLAAKVRSTLRCETRLSSCTRRPSPTRHSLRLFALCPLSSSLRGGAARRALQENVVWSVASVAALLSAPSRIRMARPAESARWAWPTWRSSRTASTSEAEGRPLGGRRRDWRRRSPSAGLGRRREPGRRAAQREQRRDGDGTGAIGSPAGRRGSVMDASSCPHTLLSAPPPLVPCSYPFSLCSLRWPIRPA